MKTAKEIKAAFYQNVTAWRKGSFYVRPTYGSGSPALVDDWLAFDVAADEVEAHARTLEGVYGEEKKKWAESNGLDNICYFRWEKGNRIYRYDLITEQTILEPKRLDYKEEEKYKLLQNLVKNNLELTAEGIEQLKDFEYRIKIHRQTV